MKTFILSIAASLIISTNAFAQFNQQEWKKTENWKAAFNSIANRNISSSYIFAMANEAEDIYTNKNAIMFLFDSNEAIDFLNTENDCITEKGVQFHRISVSTENNMAVFQGTIEGESFYMQQFTFENNDGSIKVIQIFSKNRIVIQQTENISTQLAMLK